MLNEVLPIAILFILATDLAGSVALVQYRFGPWQFTKSDYQFSKSCSAPSNLDGSHLLAVCPLHILFISFQVEKINNQLLNFEKCWLAQFIAKFQSNYRRNTYKINRLIDLDVNRYHA
jgi:hypothetical protein